MSIQMSKIVSGEKVKNLLEDTKFLTFIHEKNFKDKILITFLSNFKSLIPFFFNNRPISK